MDGNFGFEFTEYPWGCEYYLKEGRMIPADGIEQLRQHDAIFLGAVGYPGVPDHISLWDLLLVIRPGSDEVRVLQMKMATDLICKYQDKYNNCPAILGGDMNEGYNSKAVRYAMRNRKFVHAHDVAVEYSSQGQGYNSCGPYGPGNGWWDGPFEASIDYVLTKNMPVDSIRRFDRFQSDDYLLLSDHAPVYVDIVL